jgi:hypothetical protein
VNEEEEDRPNLREEINEIGIGDEISYHNNRRRRRRRIKNQKTLSSKTPTHIPSIVAISTFCSYLFSLFFFFKIKDNNHTI